MTEFNVVERSQYNKRDLYDFWFTVLKFAVTFYKRGHGQQKSSKYYKIVTKTK